uniref:Uncharacterized protein n=1 Tax=Avena sativa TaxID=4498 RepID=A0ACD6A8R4_AVESA
MNPGSSRGPSRLSCFGRNFRSGRHRLTKITSFLRGKQRGIKDNEEITMPFLPDDLVVEILSRLPLKSFCRFKCVCKSWLAFSSDPHHSQKLPRTPTGLLYQKCDYRSAIHLARLPSSGKEIDTTLSFVPCYENLRLMDCSNGLLLCCYEGFTQHFPDISHSIVCNPATQERMILPPTQPGSDSDYHVMLCFDPLWSQHFYVVKFQKRFLSQPGVHPTNETEIFSSEDFTWHSTSLLESETGFHGQSHFIHGVLYVEHSSDHCVLAMEIDATATCIQLVKRRTIRLPGLPFRSSMSRCCHGCVVQSSGVLCYAQQELYGLTMQIWSLEGSSSERWVVKHQLNMVEAFGRDILVHAGSSGSMLSDYYILAFDLDREVVILGEHGTWKFLSFCISTRKILKLRTPTTCELSAKFYYVPYYCKIPGFSAQGTQDEC